MRVIIVTGDREGTLVRRVTNYKLMIFTSSRCKGFVSHHKYKTRALADKAKKALEDKLRVRPITSYGEE